MKRKFTRRRIAVSTGVLTTMGLVSSRVVAGVFTPQQVEGPYYPINQTPDDDLDLTRVNGSKKSAEGEAILVQGRILNKEGNPVKGANIDVWQANAHGRYRHSRDRNPAPLDPNFIGFGVMQTKADGTYSFKTIKPGSYPLTYFFKQRWRCLHIHFKVASTGFIPLTTQMYFAGDPLIENDSQVARLPKELRPLVIAEQHDTVDGLPAFRFDITLAGN